MACQEGSQCLKGKGVIGSPVYQCWSTRDITCEFLAKVVGKWGVSLDNNESRSTNLR